MRPSHRSGFTLIELLVVISIVSMLASVVLAAMGGARDKATIASMQMFDNHTYQALGANLVGMWNFDNNLLDSSGNGHNGTAGGGVSFVENASKQTFKAIQLDGSSGYVDLGVLDISNDITVSTWIYADTFAQNAIIIGKNPNDYQWTLIINGLHISWRASNGTDDTKCSIPSNGKWHHITATQSGNSARMYIDGKQCAKYDSKLLIRNGTSATSNKVYIGHLDNVTGWYFNGKIDDVKIYSQSMLASEIQNMYFAGLPTHTLAENTYDVVAK